MRAALAPGAALSSGTAALLTVALTQAAAAAGAAEGGSGGTTVIGTYGYMAPEQFRGASEPASDLYALGGTLLFLLSGAGGSPVLGPAFGTGLKPKIETWALVLLLDRRSESSDSDDDIRLCLIFFSR